MASCHRSGMDNEMLIAEMNRLRDDLERAQHAKLIDYKALSQALGKNPTYVQQFVTKHSPRIMHAHLAEQIKEKLAEALKAGPKVAPGPPLARTDEEITALLLRIDGLSPASVPAILSSIRSVLVKDGESRTQRQQRDRYVSSNRRREEVPSR